MEDDQFMDNNQNNNNDGGFNFMADDDEDEALFRWLYIINKLIDILTNVQVTKTLFLFIPSWNRLIRSLC